MMVTFLRRLLLPLALLLAVGVQADTYTAGKDYKVLPTPVPTRSGDKIEVVELFWYGCPHCYKLEPQVQDWKQDLASDVDFQQLPAPLGGLWQLHAKAFFAAKVLGVQEKVHDDFFDTIHQERNLLKTEDALAEFFAEHGVDEAEFKRALNSFGVRSQLQQAKSRVRGYRVTGVPALVVNGKYVVDGESAGSLPRMLEVVDYLIQQERQAG